MNLTYADTDDRNLPPFYEDLFRFDEGWESWVIAEDDEWFYMVTRGVRNQLVMTPKRGQDQAPARAWTYGWNFRSFAAATAAVSTWDPATEDEPMGWYRRPTHFTRRRRAPRRFEKPEYNRPRCRHGSYMQDPCAVDPVYCPSSDESGRAEWHAAGRPPIW